MDKVNFFTGQPLFNQVLRLIPGSMVRSSARRHQTDHYVKHFNSYEHLVSMLFCVFQRCNSLREVCTGMQAWMNRLVHLGVKSYPKRSTLSDANKRRPSAFFQDLFHQLVELYLRTDLPDSRQRDGINKRLYYIDSSTMELFKDIMKGAGPSKADGRRKGGVKVHMQVNAEHLIPRVVYIKRGAGKLKPSLRVSSITIS